MGADPTILCFTGVTTGKVTLTWPPSCPSASDIPENGVILWRRTWGIGLIAATFNLCLAGSKGMLTPFRNLVSLSSSSILLDMPSWEAGVVPWLGSDLFRLGAGGLNQLGGLLKIKSSLQVSFPCLEQKKSRRSASSFSKEATGNPWMLAIPSATKLRYETSGASCLKTW